jgi:hypothetical protein
MERKNETIRGFDSRKNRLPIYRLACLIVLFASILSLTGCNTQQPIVESNYKLVNANCSCNLTIMINGIDTRELPPFDYNYESRCKDGNETLKVLVRNGTNIEVKQNC